MSTQSYNKKSAFSTKGNSFDNVSYDFNTELVNSVEDTNLNKQKKDNIKKSVTDSKLEKSQHERWDFVFNHTINTYDDIMAIFKMIENIKNVKEKIEIKKKIKLLVHDEVNERKITFTISEDKNKNYLFKE
ncbi:hypothetical protein [Lachnobacterium bovis]|uniref:Uncharacterized protein n=1 Tax=Lachnobacterium bovis TaxID=140626 RepID=A0A1H9Q323_9FIRM|nr:hypothetical protein [Lachnobacterium bovis]SER54782.1 hypothetical protein SAMN02910429_00426 [Lachnobacterium bovis]